MSQMLRCLKVGGQIRIATDHADYFKQIEQVVQSYSQSFEAIEFTPAADAEEGELTGTNYERKYIKDKRDIYTIAIRKG